MKVKTVSQKDTSVLEITPESKYDIFKLGQISQNIPNETDVNFIRDVTAEIVDYEFIMRVKKEDVIKTLVNTQLKPENY